LISKHGARLLLGKALLTGCLIQRNALRCGLQNKVVFLLHLRRHGGVVGFAARSQTLINKLRLQLLALCLQLRLQPRHDRLLRRRTGLDRRCGQSLHINLTL